jgi:hypothetical protein
MGIDGKGGIDMKASWISTDDEYDDYDADVTNCVLNNGKINILLHLIEMEIM